MTRLRLASFLVLTVTGLAFGQTEGWRQGTPGEPDEAPDRPVVPLVTPVPTLFLDATPPAPSDPDGTTSLYLISTGNGADTTGTNWSHLEAEGANFGAFRSQFWLRWTGLLTKLRTDADTGFGTNAWTIRKIWLVVDPATGIDVDCSPGLVSAAETNNTLSYTLFADWGDQTQAPTEVGGNGVTNLLAGYHGFMMGPTRVNNGGNDVPCFQQSTLDPDVYLLMDETGGSMQPFPSGTIAFQKLTGPPTRVRPVQDVFTLYLAPINDDTTGAATGVSYDGFNPGNFGFSPYLLFEIVKQPPVVGSNPPTAQNFSGIAPYTAAAGPTCSDTIFASDIDLDPLTFSVVDPPGGGSIALSGPPNNLGGGNWSQNITYTIPADFRGVETYNFSVFDGTNTGFGTITYVVRGNAVQNTVAYGGNTGSVTDTMRLYSGKSVPDGGDQGRLDRAPSAYFDQSVEFDNYNGIRHNANGNLFGLSFGPAPAGPGVLVVHATQSGCADPGATVVFTFDAASTGLAGPSRTFGLSVSPLNNRIACVGVNTARLFILDYTAGAGVGTGGATAVSTLTLAHAVDLGATIWAANRSIGTAWLDNDTILVLDTDGNLQTVDAVTGTVLTDPFNPYVATPRLAPNISSADIEYNPTIAPYIYVSIGEFAAGTTTNTLYVVDPTGPSIVPLSGGAQYADYSATNSTFREIALDCHGNLFLSTFVNFDDDIGIRYLPNAKNPGGITSGLGSWISWRLFLIGEGAPNFNGLDVACGNACPNAPPAASSISTNGLVNTTCSVTLSATDYDAGDTITFIADNPGSGGGTLTPTGPVTGNPTRTQQANYTPLSTWRGVECFTYRAQDNGAGNLTSNDAQVCINVRGSATNGTVAFGASLFTDTQTMRLYYGAHNAGGGTAGAEDVLTGLSFPQSVEFDNYNNVRHNPAGNLLALNFGTTLGGGALHVYPTMAECNGQGGFVRYVWDGLTQGELTRVVGLAFNNPANPANSKLAVYGVDTKKIYFLNYTPGAPAAVGKGGAAACTVSAAGDADVSSFALNPRTLGLAWLDDTTVLWVDEAGNLYTVTTAGVVTQRTVCPRAGVASISTADIEYNPAISPNVYVSIGESAAGVTTNTLYIVNPSTWAVVPQGAGNFSDHSATGTSTFREIGLDTGGTLFIGTFVDSADRVNIRILPNATTPASIANDSTVVWNVQDVGQFIANFSGLDVAAGLPVTCALPGDMPPTNGIVNGGDINKFVDCYLDSVGQAPVANCECVDTAAPFGTVTSADVAAFVVDLLN
ncbi:MAG: hypothetical protein L6Q92_13625 [Phycisphaerae bacterium]|nr:hypothetical protein [Phycisphaerae bacterium]